jgi:hypothetical protein
MGNLNIGGIPTALGEIINYKYHLDTVKHKYTQITLSFHKQLLKDHLTLDPQQEKLQYKYLNDIGQLFFSEPPYKLEKISNKYLGDTNYLLRTINVQPQKADLRQYLCKGQLLEIGPYIVITTKVRELDKNIFFKLSTQLWEALRHVSNKYKIVILGEKEVEMRKEYHSWSSKFIYCLYEQIITNLPSEQLVDLTVPALGNTVSDLSKIQQDCLIMNQAIATISIGIGGNCGLSTASSNLAIGFRNDNNNLAELIYSSEDSRVHITKNWNYFIKMIREL